MNSRFRNSNYIILGILCLTVCTSTTAQESVSNVVQRLDRSFTEELLSSGDLSFLDESIDDVSIIDKMDFRTETNRWSPERQEYMFRTSLRSRSEVASEKKWISSWKNILTIEQRKERKEHTFKVYRSLLDLVTIQRKLDIEYRRAELLRNRRSIDEYDLLYGDQVNVEDILKSERRMAEQKGRVEKLKRKVRKIESDLGSDDIYSEIELTLAPTEYLEELALSYLTIASTEDITIAKEKVRQTQLELEKEKAESARVIDFVQMKYSGNNTDVSGSQLSLGIAVTLPSGHQNRSNVIESQIDLYREQASLQHDLREWRSEVREAKSNFYEELEDLRVQEDLKELLDLSSKYENLKALPDTEAKTLVNVKEMILDQDMDISNAENSVFDAYLDLMKLIITFDDSEIYHLLTAK